MLAVSEKETRMPFRHRLEGITEKDFDRFSRLVYDNCGIKLPPHKKSMLEARLRKRLRSLDLPSFEEYGEYVFSSEGLQNELINLIDVVTTNKTDFFREAAHFNYIVETALPTLINEYGVGIERKLRVWSAGCSTGEEPYTLAMVLSEFAEKVPGFDFSILATDISTKVLDAAKLAIYNVDKIAPVPPHFQKKYLLRSKNPESNQVRIVPELRSKVSFGRVNFMDDDFAIRELFDIIFCRNVIIYFDRPTQEVFLGKLCAHLDVGRYIFMGHSETLNGMSLPLVQVAPSSYRRR